MEALKASSFPCLHRSSRNPRSTFSKNSIFQFPSIHQSFPLVQCTKPNFKIFTATSQTAPSTQEYPTDEEFEASPKDEKFDWYSNWYPVVPVCDLDKRRPTGKKVIGIDIVIWWDRNESHGRCLRIVVLTDLLLYLKGGLIGGVGCSVCATVGGAGGAGDCKFIPQAPRDGPPIHTSKRACVTAYPSCVQNGILWFWPNSDPQYKDILSEKKASLHSRTR